MAALATFDWWKWIDITSRLLPLIVTLGVGLLAVFGWLNPLLDHLIANRVARVFVAHGPLHTEDYEWPNDAVRMLGTSDGFCSLVYVSGGAVERIEIAEVDGFWVLRGQRGHSDTGRGSSPIARARCWRYPWQAETTNPGGSRGRAGAAGAP